MKRKRLLFICTANLQRSPTAEGLFKGSSRYEARSAGIHPLAARRVDQRLVDWADVIFVFSNGHAEHLKKRFDMVGKPVYNLDVADTYEKDDPRLVQLLKRKLSRFIELR
ncbi:MAG: protein tyrosine phosphatase [Candidatus Aenigmarchaeota archaeon]|nr:protein tyrosine phosphatase [Candidatus Aenigmarchaeota archaeon]